MHTPSPAYVLGKSPVGFDLFLLSAWQIPLEMTFSSIKQLLSTP